MSYDNPRIKGLNMTGMDMIIAVAGGNPGAIRVCIGLIENTPKIDPQAILGGMGAILQLDTFDIYESRIWRFYKDFCKQNLSHMIAMMRAVQLDILSESKLNHAIDNYGEGVDVPEILGKVKETLGEFKAT